MLRILHFSDLHLDMSIAADGLPTDLAKFRRADIRATLGRILNKARELKVDIVTIAGNLYEHNHFTLDTADFLSSQFKRVAPIRVFIAPGEHDPYTEQSLYALTRWPENVTIFSSNQLSNFVVTSDVQLWGAACPPMPKYSLRKVKTLDKTKVNLLLLHAKIHTTPQIQGSTAFFVDPEELSRMGVNCALLGGEHATNVDNVSGTVLLYPGSPEPLGQGTNGERHSVLLVTVDGVNVSHEVIPINHWHYAKLVIDITGCTTEGEVGQRIRGNLPVETDSSAYIVCHVTLIGSTALEISLDSLHSYSNSRLFLQYNLRLTFPYDLDKLKNEQTVRGMLVRRYLERINTLLDEKQRAVAESALHSALCALDGKRVNLNEVA